MIAEDHSTDESVMLTHERDGVARQRVLRLFQFVRALNDLRNPVPQDTRALDWSLRLSELPQHDYVVGGIVEAEASGDHEAGGSDVILRVGRPPAPLRMPNPPRLIEEWIRDGWQDDAGTAAVNGAGEGSSDAHEAFGDDPRRVAAFEQWKAQRQECIAKNAETARCLQLFENLYGLYTTLERDPERYDLVLGDGMLSWKTASRTIRFPLFWQRVELTFDPRIPMFFIKYADASSVECNSALLRSLNGPGTLISEIQESVDGGHVHPLLSDNLTPILRPIPAQLAPNGQYRESPPRDDQTYPCVFREPIVFLRKRALGFSEALSSVIEDTERGGQISPSLVNIVGCGSISPTENDEQSETTLTSEQRAGVLFTKPANAEQYRIAEAISAHPCVMVQGPPGTGKTHTIANLVGHLLAKNQRVLVTSSSPKALAVLREKIVDKLRPLCVSVIGNDTSSNDDLGRSIGAIIDRLSNTNEATIQRQVTRLSKERESLLQNVAELRSDVVEARYSDALPLRIGTRQYSAVDAAKSVNRNGNAASWVPLPVQAGVEFPITTVEIASLYRTNITVPAEKQEALSSRLPDLDELLVPAEFNSILVRLVSNNDENTAVTQYWHSPQTDTDEVAALNDIKLKALVAAKQWRNAPDWLYTVAYDASRGPGHRNAWDVLLASVEQVRKIADESRDLIAEHGPQLTEWMDPSDLEACLGEIIVHLHSGKKLNPVTLALRPRWKNVLRMLHVQGRTAKTLDEVKALHAMACLEHARARLRQRWAREVEAIGGPSLPVESPEEYAAGLAKLIRNAIDWEAQHIEQLRSSLITHGFDWDAAMAADEPLKSGPDALRAIVMMCSGMLPAEIDRRINEIERQQARERLAKLDGYLSSFALSDVEELRDAVAKLLPERYEAAFQGLCLLRDSQEQFRVRRELLQRLAQAAPAWAQAIAQRLPPHNTADVPGDADIAWDIAQFRQQFRDREAAQSDRISQELTHKRDLLERKTAELADALAWLGQRRRTGLKEQQDRPRRMAADHP